MKVVTPGNSKGEWAKKVVCPHCDSVLEVAGSDIVAEWNQANWGGDPGNWMQFYVCGFCGLTVYVGYDFCPYEILERAKKKVGK